MEQIDSETLVKYIAQLKETIKNLYIELSIFNKIIDDSKIDYEDKYDELMEKGEENIDLEELEELCSYYEEDYFTSSYLGDGVYASFGDDDRMNFYLDTETGPPYYMSIDFYNEVEKDYTKFSKHVNSEDEAHAIYEDMVIETEGLTIQEIREKFLTKDN